MIKALIHAREEGVTALDIEDFRSVFDITFKNFNPVNPFEFSGWGHVMDAVEGGAKQIQLTFSLMTVSRKSQQKRRAVSGLQRW